MAAPHASTGPTVNGVTIATPLGGSAFTLTAFRFREQLGQPFAATVDVSSRDATIDLRALLGGGLTVNVPLPQGGQRFFHGVILNARQTGRRNDLYAYELTMVPWLQLLDLGSDSRIFQETSAVEIIKEVCDELGFSDYTLDGVADPLPDVPFCLQYNETHLNFLQRLTQRYGIAFHTVHEANCCRVRWINSRSAYQLNPYADTLAFQPDLATAGPVESIVRWEYGERMAPGKIVLADYDPLDPAAPLSVEKQADHLYPRGDLERYAYPGGYATKTDGETLATVRLGELTADERFFAGEAHSCSLAVGTLFTLTGHPCATQNASYLTTAIDLQLTARADAGEPAAFSASCSFRALSSSADYRPPRTARSPLITGVQTATVVAPSGHDQQVPHTDRHGRVKVQFHWDRRGKRDDRSSCWLRHMQPFAGKGWGAVFLPVAGCEVVVAFEEGDPDRPLVLGGVYNGNNHPPRDLPDDAVKTVVQDVAGNFFILDAQANTESISLYTPYKHNSQIIGASEALD